MDELFLKLEMRIKSLLQQFEQLEQARLNLKQSESVWMREREVLLTKNKMAVSQIEQMVSRLKTIENAK